MTAAWLIPAVIVLSVASPQALLLEARVIRQEADVLLIDRGAADGLEPGDRVVFRPLGRGELEGRIVSVEERVARVRLLQGDPTSIAAGTACEVHLPEERKPGFSGANDDPVPAAPPVWSNSEPAWDPERPLLAASPQRPHERTSTWRGRVYAMGRMIREQEHLDSTSTIARSGLDLRGENPFGFGGRLRFSTDFDLRSYSTSGEASESDSHARVERFSYQHGGDRFRSLQWEVGRFLQDAAPQLGLLDGAELRWTLGESHRLGASAGWMPEPDANLGTGKDFQLSANYFYEPRSLGVWSGGASVQKTWHDGEADRELMVVQLARPILRGWDLRASAWLDRYDAADFGKDQGAELTQADLRASWRGENGEGAMFGIRQWRYPSLLRHQAGEFGSEDLFEGETTRVDLRYWTQLDEDLRLTVRADRWESEDRDGTGGELRADWRGVIGGPAGRTSLAAYRRTGSFVELTGVRANQSWNSDWGSWRLSWDSAQYAPRDAGEDDLIQHEARLNIDWWVDSGWSVSVDFGYRFGDEQDSPSFGFYLQRSF